MGIYLDFLLILGLLRTFNIRLENLKGDLVFFLMSNQITSQIDY